MLATKLVATSADEPSFAATILSMRDTTGLPITVLADTGYASAAAMAALAVNGIEPLVAISQTKPHRLTASGHRQSPRPHGASPSPGASP